VPQFLLESVEKVVELRLSKIGCQLLKAARSTLALKAFFKELDQHWQFKESLTKTEPALTSVTVRQVFSAMNLLGESLGQQERFYRSSWRFSG
jgi:hypothetical protein